MCSGASDTFLKKFWTLIPALPSLLAHPPASDAHFLPPCRRAKDLVQSNIEVLHKAAAILMEKENIDGEEFLKIVMESQAEQ